MHSSIKYCLSIFLILFLSGCSSESIPNIQTGKRFSGSAGQGTQFQVTAYGDHIIRLQLISEEDTFLPDDHYEMVVSHNWEGAIQATYSGSLLHFENGDAQLSIDTLSGKVEYRLSGQPVLANGQWTIQADTTILSFEHDPSEHFAGLGHGFTGRLEQLDLQGQFITRNYGHNETVFPDWEHQRQAPLLVPFFFSSKNYGLFLNSTFPNFFDFGSEGSYYFGIDDKGYHGQMDIFLIDGANPEAIIEQYVDLTGHPRLPQLSIFGLQLSDKVHDHNHPTPSDEQWWRDHITQHRKAGFPLDHVVNDNRWRAGGGTRCESRFEWEKERFPDPAAYKIWLDSMGLTFTLDFNRCIAEKSAGWKTDYNIQLPEGSEFHEFAGSIPDFTDPEVRDWIWNLFYSQGINPELGYPVDALWIDEVDALYTVPYDTKLKESTWAEMSNYWFLLIGKALVENGWDKAALNKRPYIWMRGLSAGAQRYGTMWSGDIGTNFPEMKKQVRGMLSAGISGVPYWGHDAGGFINFAFDSGTRQHPNDSIYARWAMQMGVFSPIWKPHGMGQSRWPLDRSQISQQMARKYGQLRYELMPYTYTQAHIAQRTGRPMARAMFLEYPQADAAWENDLQYMWGDDLLIAPMFDKNQRSVWLPKGRWYRFFDPEKIESKGEEMMVEAELSDLPVFVKAGAIIPCYEYAQSTFFMDKSKLILHIYTGADGLFALIEDDGITEAYREGAVAETAFRYEENKATLSIGAMEGTYEGMPMEREITCIFHGVTTSIKALLNGQQLPADAVAYEEDGQVLTVRLPMAKVSKNLSLKLSEW